MGRELRRTWIIEPAEDPEEPGLYRADRGQLRELLSDLEGTLHAFGGKVQIVADRVRIGVVPRQGSEPEFPIAETLGYIVEYDESVPLNDVSVTLAAADAADDELRRRQQPVAEQADEMTEEEIAAHERVGEAMLADEANARVAAAALDVDERTTEPATA